MVLKTLDQLKPIEFDNIPIELKQLPQWYGWTSYQRPKTGEYTKTPCNAWGKVIDGWQDPSNFHTFEEVKEGYEKGMIIGIGFVMTPETPFTCLDLDDLEDIHDLPADLYNLTIYSYTEISPSGNGLHTWYGATKPEHAGTKKNGIELFGRQNKFVTVTGHRYNDLPLNSGEVVQRVVNDLVDSIWGKPKQIQKKSPNLQNEGNSFGKLSDGEVVEKLCQKKPKTFKVYQGDFSDYPSQSEAVMALMNDLAFYTGKDIDQMRSIYDTSSATYSDPKQNENKFTRAANKAIQSTMNVYEAKVSNHSVSDFTLHVQGGIQSPVEVLKKPGQHSNPYIDVVQLLQVDEQTNKILKTAFNVQQILDSRIFNKKIWYDAFRQREVIAEDLPWRSREFPNKQYEQWKSSDDEELQHFIDYHFQISSQAKIRNAFIHISRKYSFHPVKTFIKSVPWDRQPRVETFFIDYLGAEDTPYTRAVARKWFTAAVKRIYEPGCKFDYMPVLVGEQGVGKSTAIQKLAPEFFNDSLRNFDIKESGEVLQSSWIIEIGELAAMKKSEEEEMKGFLSRQVDIFRPAYARTAQEFPRHCVFMGTTNNYQFLKDTTGNRRFLPIQVSDNRKFTPWEDLNEMTVAQLWAEAHAFYTAGESIDLEDEIKEVAKIIQAEYTESDVREGVIHDYLEMLLPTNWDNMSILERRDFFRDGKQGSVQREFVCVMEIWKECLSEYDDPSRMDSNGIIGILNKLGWKPKAPSRKRFKHYSIQRAFTKQ